MPRIETLVHIRHAQGLHARPAALFVQLANTFRSQVTVQKGRRTVNGKSIMGILTLAAGPNDKIHIIADGEDAAVAVDALVKLLNDEKS